MKTFSFKLYNSKNNRRLRRQINIAGIVYNHCIALYRRYYKLYNKSLKKYKLQNHLVKLKTKRKYSYWNEIPAHAIQDITDRIYRAYAKFFRDKKRKVKSSPPKFKKVKKYKSLSYNMPGKNIIAGNIIKLAGGNYKFFKPREIQGQVKVVTVKRDAVGDIYVYLVCDVQLEPVKARTGKSVGFDFGLKKFLTSSDGQDINSPDFFMENIKGMARIWGRKLYSLGFSSFVKILEYEAGNFGTQVIFVPRYFPSSQLCHVCGYKNAAVKDLKLREWECPQCHTHHDRDRNAAINILKAGASAISVDTVRPEQSGSVDDAIIPLL